MNEQDNGQLRAPAQNQGGTAQPGPAGFGDAPRFTVDKKTGKKNEAVLGPFTIRDLTVFGSTLLLFIASLIPMFAFAYNLWNLGSLFFLGLGIVLPLIVTALFVARRLSPSTKIRIGSLSIDQFASVVASFTLAFFFLAAAGAFVPSMLIALLGALGLFAATVLGRWIPFFAGDFLGREETPAHIVAREAVAPVRKPRAPKATKQPKESKLTKDAAGAGAAGAGASLAAASGPVASGPAATGEAASGTAAGWAKRPATGGQAATPAATTPAGTSAGASSAGAASAAAPSAAAPGAPETQISGVVPAAGAAAPASTGSSTASTQAPAPGSAPSAADKTRTAGVPAAAAGAAAAGAAAAAAQTAPAAEQTQAAGVPAATGGSAPTTVNPQVRPQEPIGATVDPASRPAGDDVHPAHEAFWFAVAQPRTAVDVRTGAPAFVIEPGGWVLALEDRGNEFLVQHTDGRLGVLRDLSNIERG
ncbi:hypothetical protein SAMN05660473_03865 [Arthrobacter sp. 49Tsu3.1M3]|uniref:hypothetical protein n=1 Tax=Arthrobacter sp. 49Tsu3.1M3 TaxID=1279029 RepID=UPI0009A57BAC|nr:hypothetical protein [Arthrobacter sp. 49Tsu3.1M3]SKC05869.1 hypothetical protein SAMN05660473_03865 [Arthrobacter sp. 49Tsu3.1M3]